MNAVTALNAGHDGTTDVFHRDGPSIFAAWHYKLRDTIGMSKEVIIGREELQRAYLIYAEEVRNDSSLQIRNSVVCRRLVPRELLRSDVFRFEIRQRHKRALEDLDYKQSWACKAGASLRQRPREPNLAWVIDRILKRPN